MLSFVSPNLCDCISSGVGDIQLGDVRARMAFELPRIVRVPP